MIRYSLKCANGHRFDSWFQSASAYEKLETSGLVACAECGSTEVVKDIMAPRVAASRKSASQAPAPQRDIDPKEQALAALKAHVEENATYVGGDFAKQAREMHLGDAPEQAIYGEAKLDEARDLIEDGVPVAPLPFRPTSKSN